MKQQIYIYRNFIKLLYWTCQDHYRGTTENLKYRFGKINVNKKSCLQYIPNYTMVYTRDINTIEIISSITFHVRGPFIVR